jgi:hypothetical protein
VPTRSPPTRARRRGFQLLSYDSPVASCQNLTAADYGARAMQPRACGFSVGVPPAVRHRLLTPAPLRVASVGFLQSLHEVDDWSCPGSVDGDGLSDQAAGRCFFSWLIGDS